MPPVKNNSGVQPAGQCGTWVKEAEGGLFTSPNYPNKYPPETECIYIIEGKHPSQTAIILPSITQRDQCHLNAEGKILEYLIFS